jgi:hypothetical protein
LLYFICFPGRSDGTAAEAAREAGGGVAEGGGETKEKCPLGPDCPRREKRLLDGARGVPRGVPEASMRGRRVGDDGVRLADPEVGGRGVSCQKALEARSRLALFPEDGR